MEPGERMDSEQIGTRALQDGLGTVLVRAFFRLALRVRFFGFLGRCWPLFGPFWALWARFGSSWALLGSFLATPCTICVLKPCMPISSSTLQPMACQHFAARAGGLREAIIFIFRTQVFSNNRRKILIP